MKIARPVAETYRSVLAGKAWETGQVVVEAVKPHGLDPYNGVQQSQHVSW